MRPLHLSTVLTQKPSHLLSHINSLTKKYTLKGHTLLFALSASFERPEELEAIVNALRTTTRGKGRLVGCLSGSVSELEVPIGGGGGRSELSCAIAIFDSTSCQPFYSGLPGRKKVQVGRWHSFRDKERIDTTGKLSNLRLDEDQHGIRVNWEDVWNQVRVKKDILPEELRSISHSKIHSLLYMSVPHPDEFTAALSDYSSNSIASLGLVAASTNFITGRNVTLFLDDKIYGDGTVGLALLRPEDEPDSGGEGQPQLATEFVGVQKLGDTMIVTSTEGNMINSLNGSNPTQLLLRAIADSGISPQTPTRPFEDQEFALAGVSPHGKLLRAYKITAGDPAHRGGSISLDTIRAPPKGTMVQFVHRAAGCPVSLPSSLLPTPSGKSSVVFLTVPEPNARRPSAISDDLHPLLLPNTFLATSSPGFMLSQPALGLVQASDSINNTTGPHSEDTWTCSLAGGMAVLEWR